VCLVIVHIKSQRAFGYCMVGIKVSLGFSGVEFGILSGVRRSKEAR
jgi:hypothetical protein